MVMQKPSRIIMAILYTCLCAGIVWQAKAVVQLLGPGGKFPHVRSYRVNVSGDVRRPGAYRVPEGTTQFEILKVAGVRPTSDLSTFNLMSAVGQNDDDINVGSRGEQAALKPPPISARLEFYYGDVVMTAKDGRTLPVREGMMVNEGDIVQTESSTQVELSIGSFSRMDIDNFSEVSFDKIGVRANDRTEVSLFQKAGACWYKIAYTAKDELYRVLTPAVAITTGGKGADFLVEIQAGQASINLIDGLLLIEKNGGGESINLISGQTVTIYNDARPFQISRLAPDLSATERFTQLTQGKKSVAAKNLPFNFLFCGTPAVFFVASMQFDRGLVYTVHIPPRLSVEQYAQGITTLDEAYLYGGAPFVTSIVERILNVRCARYCIFTKENIIKTADILGGITVGINGNAAGQIKAAAGPHKFTSQELVKFLSPEGTTPEESRARQRQVLNAIFEGMRSKNIVLTTQTMQQILSSIGSNMDAAELMDCYIRFNSSGNWTRKDIDLPVQENRERGRIIYEPELERCRSLLESNS
jgi:hypothetical protein